MQNSSAPGRNKLKKDTSSLSQYLSANKDSLGWFSENKQSTDKKK